MKTRLLARIPRKLPSVFYAPHRPSFCPLNPVAAKALRLAARFACGLALSLAASGCISVKTDPIRVEPIQITMDINMRVQGALDDFFGDLDEASEVMVYEEPNEQTLNP